MQSTTFTPDTSLSLFKIQNKKNCFYFNKYTYIPGSLLDSIHIDSILEYEQLRLYQSAPEVWAHPSFAQGEFLPRALMCSIYPVISNQNYIKLVLIRIVVRKKQKRDLSYLQISKSLVVCIRESSQLTLTPPSRWYQCYQKVSYPHTGKLILILLITSYLSQLEVIQPFA